MVTDWLANPDVTLIVHLPLALICAAALAATRQILPPTNPRWRVARALFICAILSLSSPVATLAAPGSFAVRFMTLGEGAGRSVIGLTAIAVECLLMAWLIPWLIEGRPLGQMGWVKRRWARYLAFAAVAGLVGAWAWHPEPAAHQLLTEMEFEVPRGNLGFLALLSPRFVIVCVVYGLLSAWCEENVFRGHLLPSLRETGMRGARANIIQALIFMAYHPASLLILIVLGHPDALTAGQCIWVCIVWFAWGLLFGLLRVRTGSIVPSFALHAAYNTTRFIFHYGPLAAFAESMAG